MEKLIEKAKAGLRNNLDRESKTLFKNSSWVFFSNFTGIALNVIRTVVIARMLGKGSYGSFLIVVAFVGIIQEFLNLNLGTAIIKFGSVYHNEQRIDKLTALIRICLRVTVVMILISIGVVILLSLVSYSTFVHQPGLEVFVILYAVAASTKYFNSISSGILRLYFKFRLNSIIQIIMDVIETIFVVTAILLYPKNLSVFFSVVIVACFVNGIVLNSMAYFELRKEFVTHARVKLDLIMGDLKSMKAFIFSNSLGNSLKSVMSQGDVLLLGILAGPTQVAIYSIAKKIGYSILSLTDPLMQSVFPQFSKLLAEKKFSETKRMLKKITLMAVIPSAIFILVTLFMKEWIFTTVFGKSYLESVHPFTCLLLSAVFSSITFWSLPLIVSLGLVKLRVKVYALAIVAGATIAYFSIPVMQASGMALALLCVNLIINSIFIYAAFQKMKVTQNS